MLLLVSVWIHVVAAMALIGGMVFLSLVLVPAVQTVHHQAWRIEFMRTVARRFQVVAWASILVLMGTGVLNLILLDQWPTFATSFGRLLIIKLLAVGVMLGLTTFHSGREARWLPRAALVFGLVVVLFAVSVARVWRVGM